MDAVLEDWTAADIPERTRAALRLLESMTKHPHDIDAAFVAQLRDEGLDDAAIRSAANVGFHYNLINRVADALDFPLPTPEGKAKLARMLNLAGRILKGTQASEPWVRGEDGHSRPPEVEAGRDRLLSAPGETDARLRRAVEAFVMDRWKHPRPGAPEFPEVLEGYVEKLALHAYRIVDEDVEAVREAGYTDEGIYELTIVGSFAAALVGLECLYDVMYRDAGE